MGMPLTDSPQTSLAKPASFLRKAYDSWMTRSLAVGGLATVLDIGVGLLCLHLFGQSTRVGAMTGVAMGGVFTFFANRYFAFKEHNPRLAKPALKFLLATGAGMVIHGQLVVLMRDQAGIPFVVAKLIADVGVFSVGQLLIMRYVVFPKKAQELVPPGTLAALEPEPEAQQAAGAQR